MAQSLAENVKKRAGGRCEYCMLLDGWMPLRHQLDHVIASKHHGSDDENNRAFACFACNHSKGPCIAGIDPVSGVITRLFHPRLHKWSTHFRWDGATLIGRTAIGRTTIDVLAINAPQRIAIRQVLIDEGVFPPAS